MAFLIFAAGMALVAAMVVLLPLWRRDGTTVDHRDGALAIFVDQIKEVDSELARGLISTEEAEAARLEIKRRMLAVERQGKSGPAGTGGATVLMVLAVVVPALAGGIYVLTGTPGTQSLPFAERATEREEDQRVADLAERLRSRLLSEEGGGATEGWELLAQTYMRMGRYADAAEALARIVTRDDAHSGHLTQYAEALIAAEGGIVTAQAGAAIDRALDMDVLNPAASYYKAQWLEQEGRAREARQLLVLRMEQEETVQPWMEIFIQQINRLGSQTGDAPVQLADFVDVRGPTAEDVQAAQEMSQGERAEFIQSMVDRLAARLEEEPGDLDGWLQLGRAYGVLGQSDKALEAYQAAEGLLEGLAEGDPRRDAVAQGIATHGG